MTRERFGAKNVIDFGVLFIYLVLITVFTSIGVPNWLRISESVVSVVFLSLIFVFALSKFKFISLNLAYIIGPFIGVFVDGVFRGYELTQYFGINGVVAVVLISLPLLGFKIVREKIS